MKNPFLNIIISFLLVLLCSFNFHTVKINADVNKSVVKWKGAKITGSHDGIIGLKSGYLIVDHGLLVGGQFIIDMNSIQTTDMSEKSNRKLDKHLKNEDFFDVEKYPECKLVINSCNLIKGEKNYKINGSLTIKEITNNVEFLAKVEIKRNQFYNAEADIEIDRTKWDIKYKSGNFFKDLGDKAILDEITLNVNLVSEGNR